ncbi:MAG: tetratricopeptide repeat protein [Zoogloeaceae bacterium]|nr:tetratricopeptide repeat protein [Zoogloeaceae bacterium]
MSLLIDALRKAEQARQESERHATVPAAEAGLALTPIEGEGGHRVVQEDLAAEAFGPAPTAAPNPLGTIHPRAAAQNLFEAKAPPPRRLFWPVVATFSVLAFTALGAYIWWGTQPRGLQVAHFPNPTPRPAPSPSLPAPVAPVPMAQVPLPPEEDSTPPPRPSAPERGRFTPAEADQRPPDRVQLRRGTTEAKAPAANLQDAYAAYNLGDLARAGRLYGDFLRQEPRNVEALNGLAAIALRQGRLAEAEQGFQRALAIDPNDAVALAGITELRSRGHADKAETPMRSLLAAQPQASPAYFALGNALAAQGRWAEAQQAYFDAHSRDPDNPDYLFNLAVSLDRLHQVPLARRFYADALRAAQSRAASFPVDQTRARLESLGASP